jgi:hypothetical protein
MFLAFVLGLGRSLLANGRSSWRLPPIGDDLALRLAPLPWLFAAVALVSWVPLTLNGVLETSLNGVITNLAPTAAFAIACVIGLYLLRHPRRETQHSESRRRAPPTAGPRREAIVEGLGC